LHPALAEAPTLTQKDVNFTQNFPHPLSKVLSNRFNYKTIDDESGQLHVDSWVTTTSEDGMPRERTIYDDTYAADRREERNEREDYERAGCDTEEILVDEGADYTAADAARDVRAEQKAERRIDGGQRFA
jgi:hypothetical protein